MSETTTVKYPEKDGLFNILIFDEENSSLTESLGITDERAEALMEVTKEAYLNSDRLTDALQKAIIHSKHINEAVFITIVMNTNHNKVRETSGGLEGLLKLLKGLKDD
jgi:hypothetical protein